MRKRRQRRRTWRAALAYVAMWGYDCDWDAARMNAKIDDAWKRLAHNVKGDTMIACLSEPPAELTDREKLLAELQRRFVTVCHVECLDAGPDDLCICGHSKFWHLDDMGVCDRNSSCPCHAFRIRKRHGGMHYCGGELVKTASDEPAVCSSCG